jgi:hypothetical protein
MFLSSFVLLELNGHPMSDTTRKRFEHMAQFVADYTQVDGTAPQLGDSDDGRLHPLSIRSHSDHRYLSFIDGADDPEHWWWFGGKPPLNLKAERSSRAYSGSGFYVLQSQAAHVFVSAATVGMHGLGSHSHNDLLSFEYSTPGIAWIVDPGSYVYTPDRDARNLFRSTAYHNTVRIDGLEINSFPEGQLFQVLDQARIKVHEWTTQPFNDVLDVEHTGYMRLNDPVCHRRRFELEKTSGALSIRDSFEGSGTHNLEWFLHLAPSTQVRTEGLQLVLEREQSRLLIDIRGVSIETQIIDGWYSPSYGVRRRAPIIAFRVHSALPVATEIRIVPVGAS